MKQLLYTAITMLVFSCTVRDRAPTLSAEDTEAAEFSQLMLQDSINKQGVAAESLDLLLNGSPLDNSVSLLINNNSDCNIIVRFSGDKTYSLPVRKNFRNFIVIDKGNYSVSANLCQARYAVQKTVTESASITLSERD